MGRASSGEGGEREGKRIECLGGMRLQFSLTLFTRATPGTPASIYITCDSRIHINCIIFKFYI